MASTKLRASTQLNNDGTLLDTGGNVTSNLDAGGQKITNVGSPSSDSDVPTKGYVDGVAEGLTVKDAVRLRAQTGISLGSQVGTATGPTKSDPGNSQIDGSWVNRKDRVLFDSQGTGSQNGVYKVADSSTALREEIESHIDDLRDEYDVPEEGDYELNIPDREGEDGLFYPQEQSEGGGMTLEVGDE